ncbi:MAG: hypothetical protein IPM60_12200 [Rhodospirillales bacterium]|nr:hypothetical protein [Rhodospirillales bacterium]
MYADHTLTPKEAIRLAALGTLALEPMAYSALAVAIRHFVSRVIGPSSDIMGHSIELLKYEGLVEEGNPAEEDEAPLRLTAAGRRELQTLLTANLRAADTALNKLVIALKFRFLHLLERAQQQAQAELFIDCCEQELARLEDLRAYHAADPGFLAAWLDQDIADLQSRLAWLRHFSTGLSDSN